MSDGSQYKPRYKRRAVATVSGGMDSLVALATALIKKERDVTALFVDYGQVCKIEKDFHLAQVDHYAKQGFPVKSVVVKIDIPITLPSNGKGYIPCRNALVFATAFSLAESQGCAEVWNGIHYGRISKNSTCFPDARREFLQAFELTMSIGSLAGVDGKGIRMVSPLATYAKQGVVSLGEDLFVPFEKSWSCWKNGRQPCGLCPSCEGRALAFKGAGITDPQAS